MELDNFKFFGAYLGLVSGLVDRELFLIRRHPHRATGLVCSNADDALVMRVVLETVSDYHMLVRHLGSFEHPLSWNCLDLAVFSDALNNGAGGNNLTSTSAG